MGAGEALLVVGLAAAGGLGALANAYPRGYRPLGYALSYGFGVLTAYCAIFLWGVSVGVELAKLPTSPMIQDGHYSFYGLSPIALLAIMVGVTGYLWFLSHLLPRLQRADPPKGGDK